MVGIVSKFSYKRLKQEVIFEDDQYHQNKSNTDKILDIIRRSSSIRFRSSSSSWVGRLKRRKFRIKISGFRRFFRIRKIKVARFSWANKVLKRLKESQSHFGDLFGGNYLFMQVSPGSFNNKALVAQHIYNHSNKFPSFPSTYNNHALGKVA